MPPDHSQSDSAADLKAGHIAVLRESANDWETAAWISDSSGNRIWLNQAWSDLSGRDPSQEIQDGWTAGLDPRDKASCQQRFRQSFETGVSFVIEHLLFDAHGNCKRISNHVVPLVSGEGPALYFGTSVVLGPKEEERSPSRGDPDFEREMIESAIEFAIFTISHERKVVSWSAGAERIFGYEEHEILGCAFDVLFTPEDRAAGIPGQELIVAAREGRSSDERWHLRKDGSRFYASGAVSPVRGSTPQKFVKIARDLTSRKLIEDALGEADRRKNEFIATLAHELRNPLAPIRTGIELLSRQETPDAVRERVLGIMESQMNTMVHLVDDLLEISRITQGKIQLKHDRVNLGDVIHSAVAACLNAPDHNDREIPVDAPEESVWVNGDAVRLEQCVVNLLLNALKFTPRDGRIEVTLHTDEDSAEIIVADSGVGLQPEELEAVFDMFTQGAGSRGGLGIGLAVVKSLAEMHGGSVSAASPGPGLGSKFSMKIPRAANTPPAEAPPGGQIQYPLSVSGTILVVDDNVDAAELLKTMLEAHGMIVRTAADGISAVSAAFELRPRFCICDIGLPGIDGYEVARRVSEQCPDTVFIAVSGWGGEEDRARSREAGFAHHLVKPVKLSELWPLLAHEEPGGLP
ncbi:ATP-binding protein [Luteolibacter arcticus]|uniref:histidine kinase n=1 Tax=Luteolibacter arcticus TaxID=1581411 RepID=A0ABT3GIN6_9BACT|nr:ATP-binding protein [Luteolibacter arcticus]MCW1923393.1 ATP-binding protein [Luteolibacter arcticus]